MEPTLVIVCCLFSSATSLVTLVVVLATRWRRPSDDSHWRDGHVEGRRSAAQHLDGLLEDIRVQAPPALHDVEVLVRRRRRELLSSGGEG